MSTITEIIGRIDHSMFPGNRFTEDDKTRWIYEVDAKAFDELIVPASPKTIRPKGFWFKDEDGWHHVVAGKEYDIAESGSYINDGDPLNMGNEKLPCRKAPELRPYRYAEDSDRKVLLPERFEDTYIHYCGAKMAAADNELEEYNNQVILYQAAWEEYASWHIRHFRPQGENRFY